MIQRMTAPLVLLHGFSLTGASWDAVHGHLTARAGDGAPGLKGREILTPDQRGHGTASDVRPILLPAMAADAMAQTTGELALGGYSMGGRAALLAAIASPGRVSHLALISTTAGIEDEATRAQRADADEFLANAFEQRTIEQIADSWGGHPVFTGQPPAVAAAARADRLRNSPAGLAASLRGAGAGKMQPLWGSLGTLTMPVLVMVGARDEKFVAVGERLADALPNAELVIVPGAGHQLPLEAPEAVAEGLANLLER